MPKTYECEIEVRGYELDSYEHVNHAVYLNYLEHARWKLLQEEGIGFAELDRFKAWPVVAGLEVRYLRPAFIGDKLRIESVLAEPTRASFQIQQRILRGSEAVLTAKIHAVMVNEQGRPTEVPSEIARMFQ